MTWFWPKKKHPPDPMVSMAAAQNLRSTSRVKTHRTIHTPDPYYAGDPDHRYGSPGNEPYPWAIPMSVQTQVKAQKLKQQQVSLDDLLGLLPWLETMWSITPHKLEYGAPIAVVKNPPHISPSLDHFERVHLAFWWLNSAWCSPQRYLKGGDFLPWSLEQKTTLKRGIVAQV